MEYFATGGTGFIGTNVVEQLVDEGHDVITATRSRSNANHLPDEVEVVEADITNKESLREPMRSVDGVFHMAAWFYSGPGPQNRETARRINAEGARNVFELIDEPDIPKGVYTSTILHGSWRQYQQTNCCFARSGKSLADYSSPARR